MEKDNYKKMTMSDLAGVIIRECWDKSWFRFAEPYVRALRGCHSKIPTGNYLQDSFHEITLRALCNLQSWRGETAREVKAEIRSRLKIK